MCNSLLTIIYMTSLLGCWQVGEVSSYYIEKDGDYKIVSREVANVPPTVSFFYDGKGIVRYCDGHQVTFDWQELSDSTISVGYGSSETDSRFVKVANKDKSLMLSECKEDNMMKCYELNASNYIINECDDVVKVKFSKQEELFLEEKNPFPHLKCYVAKGYVRDNNLYVDGQECLEIQNGQPRTQSVLFIKSSRRQRTIPCFLITYDEQGKVLYTQLIDYIKRR